MNKFFDKPKGITVFQNKDIRWQAYLEKHKLIFEVEQNYPFETFRSEKDCIQYFKKVKNQYVNGLLQEKRKRMKPYNKILSVVDADIKLVINPGFTAITTKLKYQFSHNSISE